MEENVDYDVEVGEDIPPTIREIRREKFGILADCDLLVDSDKRTITIVVDNPLPDEDRVTIETNFEKVVSVMAKKVGGTLLSALLPDVKFLDGK